MRNRDICQRSFAPNVCTTSTSWETARIRSPVGCLKEIISNFYAESYLTKEGFLKVANASHFGGPRVITSMSHDRSGYPRNIIGRSFGYCEKSVDKDPDAAP